jgi:hypothetical protein
LRTELKKERGGSKRISIQKSAMVGKPRIVLTDTSEPSAMQRAVVLDSGEFAVCFLVELCGVTDGADKPDGFEWVGVVKLFVGMDNLGVGGDDPAVEG